VSAQFGCLIKMWGRLPVNLLVAAYYNALRPSAAPTWQVHAQTSINAWTRATSARWAMAMGLIPILALSLLSACSTSVKVGPGAVAGLTPDATIEMHQVQVAYLASGGGGNGTLFYRGHAYPFTIGGLGIGGIGASTISASGQVYKLHSLAALLWVRTRQSQWWRSLAAKQCRRHPASQGEARGAHA